MGFRSVPGGARQKRFAGRVLSRAAVVLLLATPASSRLARCRAARRRALAGAPPAFPRRGLRRSARALARAPRQMRPRSFPGGRNLLRQHWL